MIRRVFAIVLVVLAPTGAGFAQTNRDHASVKVGQRVRIMGPGAQQWQLGTVVSLEADTLRLAVANGRQPLAVPLASIRALEVRRGRKSNFRRGLGFGLVGGAAVGAFVGLAEGDDPPCEPGAWFCLRFSAGQKAAGGAMVLGGLGAVVGGVIGAATKTERWAPVAPADLRVVPAPGGGVTFSASYRF